MSETHGKLVLNIRWNDADCNVFSVICSVNERLTLRDQGGDNIIWSLSRYLWGGGSRLDANFKGIGFYSSFWSPFSFMRGRKSNWDFKSDQLLDGMFLVRVFSPYPRFKVELKTNLFIKTLSSFGLLYLYVNSRLEKPC